MELWQLSATQIAAGVRERAVSSADVVRACLDRIADVNPALNALVDVRPEEALAAADRADAAVAAGERLGPLHGVPVSTKLNTAQRGALTSHGLKAAEHARAAGDDACVAALRASGAVFLGRSNVPAFSLRWFTANDAHGRTLNPWDAGRTPGGSSGGAASAVAAGMTPVSQGNDIAGSIRYPAACCGLVGVRPTVGLVSNWSAPGDIEMELPLTAQAWSVHGPLARTVADARAALWAMASPDPRDPFGVPALPELRREPGPVRVYVVRDVGMAKPHPSVDAAVTAAAGWLADAGYAVEERELPLLEEAARLWALLLTEDLRLALPVMRDLGDDALRTNLERNFAYAARLWGEAPGTAAYIQGWARRATLITRLQELLGANALLLTPASAEPPFEQDADTGDPERALGLFPAQWPMVSVPVLGFPAVTVPAGAPDGLPIGVQLVGGRFTEDLVLDAAQAVEDRAPSLTPPAAL
ncbi:amidase [Actinomadura fibrosa]|uniref:Amidase n=1 Tax=Actinomadura fibrosa TaxID=111802 RepID=A0ABW2XNM8_9ACTN|nr:amidase [Actinomadura fibrosa]